MKYKVDSFLIKELLTDYKLIKVDGCLHVKGGSYLIPGGQQSL